MDTERPSSVLVMADWPRGFCALHAFTDERCNVWCIGARMAFAQAAADLEAEWPRWERRQHLKQRKAAA